METGEWPFQHTDLTRSHPTWARETENYLALKTVLKTRVAHIWPLTRTQKTSLTMTRSQSSLSCSFSQGTLKRWQPTITTGKSATYKRSHCSHICLKSPLSGARVTSDSMPLSSSVSATSEDARSLDLFTPRGDEAVLSTSLSNKL